MSLRAVSLDLFRSSKGAEVALFALHNFYIELYVERISDEIIRISPFDCAKRLDLYLDQVDIEEIRNLTSFTD